MPPTSAEMDSLLCCSPREDRRKKAHCGRKKLLFRCHRRRKLWADLTPTHTHTNDQGLRCWQDEVVCCFKSGDNCPQPQISKMTSAVKLALQFWTQACILAWTSRTEHKWTPNVRECQEHEHTMQNSKTVPEVEKRKWGNLIGWFFFFPKWKWQHNKST